MKRPVRELLIGLVRRASVIAAAAVLVASCADDLERQRTLPADPATLEAALLTPDQLPGYRVNEEVDEPDRFSPPLCEAFGPVEAARSHAVRTYAPVDRDTDESVVVWEVVEVFPADGAAERLDDFRGVSACSERGAPAIDVASIWYELIDRDSLGDETLSYTMLMHGGTDIDSEVTMVRLGDTVVTVGTLAFNPADPAIPEGVVQRAVERVEAAALR
jgi:hypothetical protein